MRNSMLRAGTIVATIAMGATPLLAQGDREMSFSMPNTFTVKMGDYMLPEGEYRLEQIDRDTSVFVLYHEGDDDTQPIAMIDVWRVPDPAALSDGDSEVRFQISEDPHGKATPVLHGWTIEGVRWKIRDVVEAEESSVLMPIFSN